MGGISLAGARAPESLECLGISRVPLLKVQGVTILERTCQALLGAGCTAVYVLSPPELPLPRFGAVFHAAYSGDVIRDMFDCLELRVTADNVVVSSADMPLVNVEAMLELVAIGRRTGADIVYPAVERQALELCFPDTKRTYLRLGRQVVTGGNAIWLCRYWLLKHKSLIWRLFKQRKSIAALARFFGLGFLIRILLGWASVASVESYLSRLMGGRLKAAILDNIELGIDLDKVEDLETMREYIDPWDGSARSDCLTLTH